MLVLCSTSVNMGSLFPHGIPPNATLSMLSPTNAQEDLVRVFKANPMDSCFVFQSAGETEPASLREQDYTERILLPVYQAHRQAPQADAVALS